ncbi:MAG: hydroxylamine reductase [Methanosarcinaceae archaeon]
MFCYQCEETLNQKGCTKNGICGKKGDVADLQDDLIYVLKGVAYYNLKARAQGIEDAGTDQFIMDGLFATITNANFSSGDMESMIVTGIALRDSIKDKLVKANAIDGNTGPDAAVISASQLTEKDTGILTTKDENVRSLRELLTYGMKGMAAYAHHAYVLGYQNSDIFEFMERGLAATLDDEIGIDALLALNMECGEKAVTTMALLDEANTQSYGNPEPTAVNIGVKGNPGILISGHDLHDLELLLEQTKGSGVDVYSHGEMLPANSYPAFKKYDNFVGNYGGAWWEQTKEFEAFNGPVLMTTNCLVPPKDSYKNRVYATGVVGFDGIPNIEANEDGYKDFSAIIEQAKTCPSPQSLEEGTIMGGFAHAAVLSVADKVVEAVKSGAIKKFVVMAGCDGRHKSRQYYTDFAEALPKDTVILTAGCAKYRFNKLDLGDIGGIPRILDAGQCNDSYSLVVIAQKLAEAFELEDINDLPIAYNIAWYEQKAVTVLLALLSLGVKNITLGPELPAFVSPTVLGVLVDKFNIAPNTNVDDDLVRLV